MVIFSVLRLVNVLFNPYVVLYQQNKFNDLKWRSYKSKYIWHLDLYIYVKDLTNDIWKVSFIFFQFLTCTQRKREFFGTHYEEPELLSYCSGCVEHNVRFYPFWHHLKAMMSCKISWYVCISKTTDNFTLKTTVSSEWLYASLYLCMLFLLKWSYH